MKLRSESVPANTKFACKLFRQLWLDRQSANVFLSPASLMLCLGLLYEGAKGETRASIANVLGVDDLDPATLDSAMVDVKSALRIQGVDLELTVANSLWCSHECAPRSEYVNKVKNAYAAETFVLDFAAPEALAQVNSWISANTRGKIGSILSTVNPSTMLLVVNAVHFKDLWANRFGQEFTHDDVFYVSDGRTINIPMMLQGGSYRYYEEAEFQSVALRYNTSRLEMYIFLPAKTSHLEEFTESVSPGALLDWSGRFQRLEGCIQLPRFALTHSKKLNDVLGKLGMGIAFHPRRAQFHAIHLPPPAAWVSEIVHQAVLEVNEEGTEAATITEGAMFLSSEEAPQKFERTFEMIVNRPFFFLIRDRVTGTILFMGAVENPEQ